MKIELNAAARLKQTVTASGDYEDNNGKMKVKKFKSDTEREKWIDKQGTDIKVDSYRDPE
jgi:hypothetical protein